MSYKGLQVWQLAREVVIDVHAMTFRNLPKVETYEEGAQIRRSVKSIKSNIVEGYGRRRYKQDYIRFLTYAHASCDETKDHLETLFETGSLVDELLYRRLHDKLEELGRKLSRFLEAVEREHRSLKEERAVYEIHR